MVDEKYVAEVVKYFRRKGTTSFDPITYLGAEQRFVGPLRNSSVNNLEEQYLFGVDSYTETITDADGNTIIEKSFHTNDVKHADAVNYYKIITSIYKEGTVDESTKYYFEDDKFYIPYAPDDIRYGDELSLTYPNKNALYMINNDIFKIDSEDNDKIRILPPYIITIQKDELHYISSTSDVLILTKEIKTSEIERDGQIKKITYETIKNHLLK